MHRQRFLYVLPLALVVSACALVQPIYRKNAITDADDCIANEARAIAPSSTALEAAVAYVLRRCDIEIHAAEENFLAQTQGDERSAASRVAQIRGAQRDLARHMISEARAI